MSPSHAADPTLTYPKSVGRNFNEILRVVDALQLTDIASIATPADWKPGDRVIVSLGLSTDEARERFVAVEEVKPYLSWTPQPQA